MSAEVRTALATAASTVAGITVSPYFMQNLRPGQGAVRLASSARSANGFGYVNTWQVWIALNQDVAVAEKWLDAHTADLLAALEPELLITTITPSDLLLPGGSSVNGVIVEGAREG